MTRTCLRPAADVPHLPSIFLDRGETKTNGRSAQADVVIDETLPAYRIRREMETLFAPKAEGRQRVA